MNAFQLALRRLLKSPGFTVLAVGTLALGIGANTAIFSLIHDLFLRSLPFAEPDRVVRIYSEAKDRKLQRLPYSVPRFWNLREGQTVFTGVAADSGTGFNLTGLGDPVQINGDNVSANFFSVLGIRPLMGRLFMQAEEQSADVALVSEGFWRKRLNSDPNVIGRGITLNDVAYTIVGVMPEMPISWFGPDCEVFAVKPFALPGLSQERLLRGVSYLRVIGRLKPGVTNAQLQGALDAVHKGYIAQYPGNADNSWTPFIVPAAEDATGNLRPAFFTLLAAVGFVLLIACSNVANLLLVRFSARRREIAVRLALGSPRRDLVRLFIVEGLVVSLLAAGFGLLIASGVINAVRNYAGSDLNPNFGLPLSSSLGLHWPVLLFTLVLSFAVGIVTGLYPALQGARADIVTGLRDSGRGVSGSQGQQRFRGILVGTQVALSVVLLAGASLLMTSFVRLYQQDAGFRIDRVWVAAVGLSPSAYPDAGARTRFAERLLESVRAAPGVEAAAISDSVPLTNNTSSSPYVRADQSATPLNQRPLGLTRSISPGYLGTMSVPLVSGRDFNDRDSTDGPPVALISRASAKRLYPDKDPVGQQLYFGTDNGTGMAVEIVGVVGDVRSVRLTEINDVEFYRPFSQRGNPFEQILVRTSGPPTMAAPIVRAALNQIDSNLPIIQPSTMTEVVAASLGPQRLTTGLLGAFAVVALVLAMVGIYGAVAYTVEQRAGEIGVRMALGARPANVVRLVLGQGLRPVLLGLVVGLFATLGLGRLIAAQLFEISPHDPALLAATLIVLALVAIVACLVPAFRATRVDPVVALRAN